MNGMRLRSHIDRGMGKGRNKRSTVGRAPSHRAAPSLCAAAWMCRLGMWPKF